MMMMIGVGGFYERISRESVSQSYPLDTTERDPIGKAGLSRIANIGVMEC